MCQQTHPREAQQWEKSGSSKKYFDNCILKVIIFIIHCISLAKRGTSHKTIPARLRISAPFPFSLTAALLGSFTQHRWSCRPLGAYPSLHKLSNYIIILLFFRLHSDDMHFILLHSSWLWIFLSTMLHSHTIFSAISFACFSNNLGSIMIFHY